MNVNECIFFQLASSSRAGNHVWNRKVDRFGLTGVQALVVNFLGEENGVTFQQMAERLHLSNATLTGIVDRLEKTGLVQRLPNPKDRRSLLVSLTERGVNLTDDLKVSMVEANRDFLASLSHEEEVMLRGLLDRLAARSKS